MEFFAMRIGVEKYNVVYMKSCTSLHVPGVGKNAYVVQL